MRWLRRTCPNKTPTQSRSRRTIMGPPSAPATARPALRHAKLSRRAANARLPPTLLHTHLHTPLHHLHTPLHTSTPHPPHPIVLQDYKLPHHQTVLASPPPTQQETLYPILLQDQSSRQYQDPGRGAGPRRSSRTQDFHSTAEQQTTGSQGGINGQQLVEEDP